MTVSELNNSIKSKLFYEYYQSNHKKKILNNISLERSNINISDIIKTEFFKQDTLINKMVMTGTQLDYIKRFNQILGFKY